MKKINYIFFNEEKFNIEMLWFYIPILLMIFIAISTALSLYR